MLRSSLSKFILGALFVLSFSLAPCLAQTAEVKLVTGGTQIALSGDWEILNQPETFYVQKRARSAEIGVALSAGSFNLELPTEQYVAMGIAGLIPGPEQSIEKIAALAHLSVKDAEMDLQSKIGRQTLQQMKEAFRSVRFEFVGASKLEISGTSAYEVRSKMTILASGQTVFSRQFIYAGNRAAQIVQITFAGASDEIFKDKRLLEMLHRPHPEQ
jgi:hypothetical protein